MGLASARPVGRTLPTVRQDLLRSASLQRMSVGRVPLSPAKTLPEPATVLRDALKCKPCKTLAVLLQECHSVPLATRPPASPWLSDCNSVTACPSATRPPASSWLRSHRLLRHAVRCCSAASCREINQQTPRDGLCWMLWCCSPGCRGATATEEECAGVPETRRAAWQLVRGCNTPASPWGLCNPEPYSGVATSFWQRLITWLCPDAGCWRMRTCCT